MFSLGQEWDCFSLFKLPPFVSGLAFWFRRFIGWIEMGDFRIFMDDNKETPPKGFNVRTYTVEQTIKFLKHRNVSMMSLDHDLGTEPDSSKLRKNGEHLLK